MRDVREVRPSPFPGRVQTPAGLLPVPEGWELVPPGDAALTRRLKEAGDHWVVREPRGRKVFARGLYAPADTVARLRAELAVERADPAHARRKEADKARRDARQADYVEDFRSEVLAFLGFVPPWDAVAGRLADAVTAHATPVGSGTVARTERIPVAERAEAAVIAWMRHRTTAYDDLRIARVRGARREVRRELAATSRRVLDRHRRAEPHAPGECPLCRALAGEAGSAAG